jgi:sugar lactone lactonase YvrE
MAARLSVFVLAVSLCAVSNAAELKLPLLKVDREFKVPDFQGKVQAPFDDLTYLEGQNKLQVANRAGMGEFPIRDGEIVFEKPGFVAECPNCEMRGFVKTKAVALTALIWARKVLSVAGPAKKTTEYPLPAEITDACGLSHDGECYLVGDTASNTVYRLKIDKKKNLVVASKVKCEGSGLEAVTFFKGLIWTCEGRTLAAYDKEGKAAGKWALPGRLSGIVFAEGYLWATAMGEKKMYRFVMPEIPSAGTASDG